MADDPRKDDVGDLGGDDWVDRIVALAKQRAETDETDAPAAAETTAVEPPAAVETPAAPEPSTATAPEPEPVADADDATPWLWASATDSQPGWLEGDGHGADGGGNGEGSVVTDEPEDEEEQRSRKSRTRVLVEWGAVIGAALVVALLIKTFLLQAFFIPSSSMEPTLDVGDRVLVNKLSYDFHDVNRGDLIVFERPPNEPGDVPDLIKRVIGLPGETLEIRNGQVFIDGQLVVEPYLAEGTTTTDLLTHEGCLNTEGPTCEIPEDRVFVMGDNRPASRDSRFFGPIEEDLIVGRAFVRVWPLGDISWL